MTSSTPEQLDRIGKLREAISKLNETFHCHKSELGDLRQAFWTALAHLSSAAMFGDPQQLLTALKDTRRQLGSPGDFGYGTPCGDALRAVYDAWSTQ